MKLLKLLWLVLLYYHLAHGFPRRDPNLACLVRNFYWPESFCNSPRRVFYTFYRILFGCIRVTTTCPRMHRYNEYDSLEACRDDCAYFTVIPTTTTTTPKPTTKRHWGGHRGGHGHSHGHGHRHGHGHGHRHGHGHGHGHGYGHCHGHHHDDPNTNATTKAGNGKSAMGSGKAPATKAPPPPK